MPRWTDFLHRLRGESRAEDRDRMRAVLALNRQLAAAAGRQQVLTVLVDEAVRLFGAERGFLVTPAGAAPGFQVEVARNLDREAVPNAARKVSRTILARALEQGEGLFSDDAQADELGAAASVADLRLRSVLSMPLRVGDRILGCLYLDHRFHAGVFSERDLPWLMAFADQGAIVLHLHELLAQNRAQAEALAAHNRSLQAAVAAQAEALAAPAPLARETLKHAFPGLLGEAPAFLRALQVLDRVAATDLPVLLTGESGTGKELAARALHAAGPRRRGEFVALNTAAIAEGLLESELFGHSRGAFTGAERDRPGLLRQAAGGTLFLDEVTEMDFDLQAKLLRALEAGVVRPVGGDREFGIDVRLVAATNREPRQAIADGRLREDLYFRLAVVTVHLPSLRERPEDVVPLAQHFLAAVAREQGAAPPAIAADLGAALRARPWPGNVRQLRNEMQRLWALAAGGPLSPALLSPADPEPAVGPRPDLLDLAQLERWAIERALAAAKGNKAEAARLLGIGRRTLYSKLGQRPAPDG
ncbi:MAG: sigma 54-interacting transcriptional regulator [Planctomycetes bacterium]|nr:sigma 54-interacting transcriptional regulator [Planctomycetota bacterium]